MRRPRRRLVTVLALLALVALGVAGTALLAACGHDDAAAAGNGVVVRVNRTAVTEKQLQTVRADERLSGTPDDRQTALTEAVRRELVRQEAERLGVKVTAADLEKRLTQVRERAGGAEGLAKALEQAGMSRAQLREAAAYGLLREQLGDAKFLALQASDVKVRAFYERHRGDLFTQAASLDLATIQVPTKALAQKVIAKVRGGMSFADAARTYSRDPVSKESGGKLGWILESSLPAPLDAAVAKLKPGQLSGPVDGPGGWFVLRLLGRRPEHVVPFAGVRRDLQDLLTGRLRLKALDRWVEQARSQATIDRPGG